MTELNTYTHFNNQNWPEERATTFCKLKAYNSSDHTTFGSLTIPPKSIINFVIALENISVENVNDLACKNEVESRNRTKNKFRDTVFNHPCSDFPHNYFFALYTSVRLYFTLKLPNQNIKGCKIQKQNPELTILKNL